MTRARVSLTPRCLQILPMLADGWTFTRMGKVLGISEWTAKKHTQILYRELGVHSAAECIATAVRLGIYDVHTGKAANR